MNNLQAEIGRLRQVIACLKGWCHHQAGDRQYCPAYTQLCHQCLSVICMCNVPQFRLVGGPVKEMTR